MSNEPTLSTDQANVAIAAKTAPKITVDGIKARIAGTSYIHHDELTFCVINMENGFHVTGQSAPASKANFDPAIGERLAYDDAFKKIWALEGYLLKDKLWRESQPAPAAPGPNAAGEASGAAAGNGS